MFGFIIALVLIMLGGVGVFVLYTKGGGVKMLKHTLKTSYLALKNPQTTFTKGQFLLHLAKMLVLGMVLIVGILLTFYLKFMFNKRVKEAVDIAEDPEWGSLEHRVMYPDIYED